MIFSFLKILLKMTWWCLMLLMNSWKKKLHHTVLDMSIKTTSWLKIIWEKLVNKVSLVLLFLRNMVAWVFHLSLECLSLINCLKKMVLLEPLLELIQVLELDQFNFTVLKRKKLSIYLNLLPENISAAIV